MDPLPRTPELPGTSECLLEQQQFLRRLARGLARDEAAADDLVQDTLTVALERGPAEGASRPWLATVLRRLALNRRRGGARRRDRERRTARPEAVAPDAAALDLRLDVQALLTERLRALPPEQRHALALRYSDGLSPRAIARLVEAPEATVKSRLRRGLARLRADLDARYPEGVWSLALLPRPALDPAPQPAPQPGGGPPGRADVRPPPLGSGLAPVGALRVVAAFGLALVATITLAAVLRPGASASGAARAPARSVADPGAAADRLVAIGRSMRRPSAAAGASAAATSSPAEIAGAAAGRRGTSSAEDVGASPAARELPRLAARFRDASAPASFLRVELAGEGDEALAGRLWFESPTFERRRDVELRGRGGPAERLVLLRVPAWADVTVGAELDGLTVTPVTPVTLQAAGPDAWAVVTLILAPDGTLARLTLLLDPVHGAPALSELEGERWLLAVHAPGAALAMPLRSPTVLDGRLDVGGLPPGEITVSGVPLGAAGSGATEALVLCVRAELVPGERAVVRAEVSPGGSFRIEALGPDGARLAGRVEVEREGGARWPVRLRTGHRWGPDLGVEAASVIVPPLAPGPAVLHVTCDGHRAARVDVVVRSGEVQPLAVRLDPD